MLYVQRLTCREADRYVIVCACRATLSNTGACQAGSLPGKGCRVNGWGVDMQAGGCRVQCLQQEPCRNPPELAPVPAQAREPEEAHQHFVRQQPFMAKHKYQPAPAEAPILAASAPPQQSNSVCTCGSTTQGVRAGPVITFQYAGELEHELL
jgi:hypothetical protein